MLLIYLTLFCYIFFLAASLSLVEHKWVLVQVSSPTVCQSVCMSDRLLCLSGCLSSGLWKKWLIGSGCCLGWWVVWDRGWGK